MPAPQSLEYFAHPRTCATCGVVKTVDEFYIRANQRNKPYRQSSCIECCRVINASKYQPEKQKRIRAYEKGTPKALLKYFKNYAKRRGQEIDLSDVEYLTFRKSGCFYCNGALPLAGIGLDRLDNSKGYLFDNVVPCCTTCNRIRGDSMNPSEMYEVAQFLKWLRK